MALVDPKGLERGLQWQARDALRELAARYYRQTGLHLKVRSGRRSCAEQAVLYAQGRTSPGSIVTNARGCLSWHVWARAADLDPVDAAGRRTGRGADYTTAGLIWESLGGKWGGRFAGLGDIGHFEWHPGMKISALCPNPAQCGMATANIATQGPLRWYVAFGAVAVAGAAWGYARLREKSAPYS